MTLGVVPPLLTRAATPPLSSLPSSSFSDFSTFVSSVSSSPGDSSSRESFSESSSSSGEGEGGYQGGRERTWGGFGGLAGSKRKVWKINGKAFFLKKWKAVWMQIISCSVFNCCRPRDLWKSMYWKKCGVALYGSRIFNFYLCQNGSCESCSRPIKI